MTAQLPDTTSRRYYVGLGFLFATGVLWSSNGAFIKIINDSGHGPHGIIIAFYRSLFAGLFLLPFARGRFHTLLRSSAVPRQRSQRSSGFSLVRVRYAAFGCAALYAVTTVCFVVASTTTEAANAIILQYTSTFWVFALSPLILNERPSGRDVATLCLAISGIAVIMFSEADTDLFGLLNGLGAGLAFGLLTMMIRRIRDSDPVAVIVFCNLGTSLLILPVVVWLGGAFVPMRSFLLLSLMGVVQLGIPYCLYALGLARVPAHQAALVTMAEPLLVPLWTYLAVGEVVPNGTIVGGSIIFVALLIFGMSAQARGKRERVRAKASSSV